MSANVNITRVETFVINAAQCLDKSGGGPENSLQQMNAKDANALVMLQNAILIPR